MGYLLAFVLFALLILCISGEFHNDDKCKSMGGHVISNGLKHNCLRKEEFDKYYIDTNEETK